MLARRPLGSPDTEVSVLGYGALELRGVPKGRDITEEDAAVVLNEALDAGITFIDTSVDYGLSEERIGRHLSHRRSEFILATKCGCTVGWKPTDPDDESLHDFGRDNIRAGLEQSLTRLQTDHVDLLQLHEPPDRASLEAMGVAATLAELRDEGLVRLLGVSSELPALEGHVDMGVFDVVQLPYSLLDRRHEEMIGELAAAGVGVVARNVLARGVPGAVTSRRGKRARLASEWNRVADRVGGDDPFRTMIRFALAQPGISTILVGTASAEHLARNVDDAKLGPLGSEEVRRLASIV